MTTTSAFTLTLSFALALALLTLVTFHLRHCAHCRCCSGDSNWICTCDLLESNFLVHRKLSVRLLQFKDMY